MSMSYILLTGLMAAAFAAIHLFIGKIAHFERTPRNGWLSFAGGVAVAYVFLNVLPELGAHGETFADSLDARAERAEVWVYGLALAGLSLFYGLERAVKGSQEDRRASSSRMSDRVLLAHVASFATLNLIIGYLLVHREDPTLPGLSLYFVAMALHFATADFGMRSDHRDAYDRLGRWIIAVAVLAGWAVGLLVELPKIAIGCLFAFVAGGVVLNVMKEELPEDRKSRFLPFALGVLAYGALVFGKTMI
ncbi:hypothetical protein [Altererythrobacter sp. MF3-039]|uniref:hypothetical protein n=1 Tax=Altererythrobacter sp. MF3-039 TaxID=3252901 RepID=UPI00390C50F9